MRHKGEGAAIFLLDDKTETLMQPPRRRISDQDMAA